MADSGFESKDISTSREGIDKSASDKHRRTLSETEQRQPILPEADEDEEFFDPEDPEETVYEDTFDETIVAGPGGRLLNVSDSDSDSDTWQDRNPPGDQEGNFNIPIDPVARDDEEDLPAEAEEDQDDLHEEDDDPQDDDVPSNSDDSDDEENEMAQEGVAKSGQVSLIPLFSGKEGQEALSYMAAVDRAQRLYNWSEASTCAGSQARLEGDAYNWLRALEAAGKLHIRWNDQEANAAANPPVLFIQGFKTVFFDRFCPKYTTQQAVKAITDLKKTDSESIAVFYDRVQVNVDLKNYDVQNKDTAAYRNRFESDVKIFFLSGLPSTFRQKVMGVANPPDTLPDLLRVCRNIEAEEGRTKVSVSKTTTDKPKDDTDASQEGDETSETVNFTRQGRNAPRRQAPANLTCHTCGGQGHYAADCASKGIQAKGQPRGGRPNPGRGRGRGNYNYQQPPQQYQRQARRGQGYSSRGAMNADRGRPHNPYQNSYPQPYQHQPQQGAPQQAANPATTQYDPDLNEEVLEHHWQGQYSQHTFGHPYQGNA